MINIPGQCRVKRIIFLIKKNICNQRRSICMWCCLNPEIRRLSSKMSKLNFCNQLHPKIAFLCRFWTQKATWQPNHTILTSSVKAILKAMIDTGFLRPSLGGVSEFFNNGRRFLQRERVLWGWLADPSHMGYYGSWSPHDSWREGGRPPPCRVFGTGWSWCNRPHQPKPSCPGSW